MCYVSICVCLMCGVQSVLCLGFQLFNVWGLVCVLCGGFGLCYVQFATTNRVASLHACLAPLGKEGPNKGPREAPNNRCVTWRTGGGYGEYQPSIL